MFLKMMEEARYECKCGKHTALRSNNQKQFIRLRSLGDSYSEEAIRAVIEMDNPHNIRFDEKH